MSKTLSTYTILTALCASLVALSAFFLSNWFSGLNSLQNSVLNHHQYAAQTFAELHGTDNNTSLHISMLEKKLDSIDKKLDILLKSSVRNAPQSRS